MKVGRIPDGWTKGGGVKNSQSYISRRDTLVETDKLGEQRKPIAASVVAPWSAYEQQCRI